MCLCIFQPDYYIFGGLVAVQNEKIGLCFPAVLHKTGREALTTNIPNFTHLTMCSRAFWTVSSHFSTHPHILQCVKLPAHANILQLQWNCHLKASQHHIMFIKVSAPCSLQVTNCRAQKCDKYLLSNIFICYFCSVICRMCGCWSEISKWGFSFCSKLTCCRVFELNTKFQL